jgi:hypothetical protein
MTEDCRMKEVDGGCRRMKSIEKERRGEATEEKREQQGRKY